MTKLNLNKEILSIRWTLDDLKELFQHNGLDFTQSNIDEFLSYGVLDNINDISISRGWEQLEQNMLDFIIGNEEKLGANNYSLRMSKNTIANIAREKIEDEIKSHGGEIGEFLSMYEGNIINYIFDELQSNTMVDINSKIKEYYWNYKDAYSSAIEEIVSSILPNVEEYLFENLSEEEADKLLDFIFSQEDFKIEDNEDYVDAKELNHPTVVKLDDKPCATMGVSKAVSFKELESLVDKHIEKRHIFDYSIYVREANSGKKFRSYVLGGSWYHENYDSDEDLVLYKSLFDDTAVLGKKESEFLLEYSL